MTNTHTHTHTLNEQVTWLDGAICDDFAVDGQVDKEQNPGDDNHRACNRGEEQEEGKRDGRVGAGGRSGIHRASESYYECQFILSVVACLYPQTQCCCEVQGLRACV